LEIFEFLRQVKYQTIVDKALAYASNLYYECKENWLS